jgi:probable F420-dependent oxidoreductase
VEVTGVRAAVDLAAGAEPLGYTDVWTAEVGAVDAFSPLAAIAERTSTVRLGAGLIPAYTRPPALAAMSAASVQGISGGRFVLAIGTSSPPIVGGWMGLRFERPLATMREYVEVLREALAGKKVSHRGEALRSEGFRLQTDVGTPVPIHLGALGPEMCRLAGAVADGVLFFLMTPEGVRRALEHVAAGAAEAGRDPENLDVVIRLPVVLDEPADVHAFMTRRLITSYAITPGYNRSLARQGFTREAAAILEAWNAGNRDGASSAVTDEMVERLFLPLDAAGARARIEDYRAAGVRTPILMPLSFAGSPEERAERVTATVAALAPSPASASAAGGAPDPGSSGSPPS